MQQNFAKTIKNARIKKGISQRQLAKNIAINYTYLNKMERGANSYPPSEKVLDKLALELDLDIQYLKKISGRIDANAIANFQLNPYRKSTRSSREVTTRLWRS